MEDLHKIISLSILACVNPEAAIVELDKDNTKYQSFKDKKDKISRIEIILNETKIC